MKVRRKIKIRIMLIKNKIIYRNHYQRRKFIPPFLISALQKTPSLLGAECQGAGTTPLHANERGQTVRFVAVIEPRVYSGISTCHLAEYFNFARQAFYADKHGSNVRFLAYLKPPVY